MADEVVFRDAERADLDRMLEAQRETAVLTYEEVPTDRTFAALADRTRVALAATDSTHHRIRVATPLAGPAEPEGSTRAAITYAWIERRAGNAAFLVDFHVSDPQRRSGVADQLFDEVLAVARSWGCRRVEFRVGRDNHRALRFFRRRGATGCPTVDGDGGPRSFVLTLADPDPPTGALG